MPISMLLHMPSRPQSASINNARRPQDGIELNDLESRPTRENTTETCVICLSDLEINSHLQSISTLDCNHIFHRQCIEDWRDHGHSVNNMRCPVCLQGAIAPTAFSTVRNWVYAGRRSRICIILTTIAGLMLSVGCFTLVGIAANIHRVQPAENSNVST